MICDHIITSNKDPVENAPTTSFPVPRIHALRTASYNLHRNTRHTRHLLGSSLFAASPADTHWQQVGSTPIVKPTDDFQTITSSPKLANTDKSGENELTVAVVLVSLHIDSKVS
jgi:hypothetical protein